jgi:Starch-binding associating with outer membrane
MKNFNRIWVGMLMLALLTFSCQKFEVLNKDPNNLNTSDAAPDYLMANVLTSTAMDYGNLGSGTISGAIQHTAQDAWSSGYSNYDWGTSDWSGIYGRLRNNQVFLQKAQTNNWKFHQGVGLVMRAFNFGYIADFWGDAPYTAALKGDVDAAANRFPAFDSQESIYAGVIADLKAAIPLLAGSRSSHPEITPVTESSDVFYQGDNEKWGKLANTLLLRYYLRISAKKDVKADVESLASKVFTSNEDDFAMPFPGLDNNTAYQKNSAFGGASNFQRNKMSATLVTKLLALKDPRLVMMAEPIVVNSVVDASQFAAGDVINLTKIINGVRYINPAAAAALRFKQFNQSTYSTDRPWSTPIDGVKNFYDTTPVYVGIPISYFGETYAYNINGTGGQSNSHNDFVSYMRRDIYEQKKGDLLKQRMASYNEVCFDLAEAAQRGWSVGGSAATWYNKGVKASFDLWEVFNTYQEDVDNYSGCVKDFDTYIAQPSVAYDGSLSRIIEQKWVAAWQASVEAYMDWRRTGLPTLNIGYVSIRGAIPLRFAYHNTELQSNTANTNAAISKLEASSFAGPDGKNSPWSKCWLLQGTGKPW